MKISVLAIAVFGVGLFTNIAHAQESKVDYSGEVIVDSDLDGLTDKGEQQLYHTDPGNQDTDDDGYLDGAEVLASTNPLDLSDYPGHRVAAMTAAEQARQSVNRETPWAWYVARSAGLVGFVLLWITIFLGLSIRNPLLEKIIQPVYSFDFHCFVAAAAVMAALIHGTSLLFDQTLGFSLSDIAIPYFSKTNLVNPNFLALGIMAFYAMVVMTITSYLRRHLQHWLWRVLHFLNPVAFVFVVVHGYMNGTDMKNFWIGSAFLLSSVILTLIYLHSLLAAVWRKLQKPEPAENMDLAE